MTGGRGDTVREHRPGRTTPGPAVVVARREGSAAGGATYDLEKYFWKRR